MNYFVPNFGPLDATVKGDLDNIGVAERMFNREFWPDVGSDESKERHENPAKKVDYNFDPKLDENMVVSIKNLANAEKSLDHKYSLDLIEPLEYVQTEELPKFN